MWPPGVGNIGLLEHCQQAGLLAKYWAGKAIALVTRRQAQAAKAKAGLPATITKDKLRQALERWVNKQLRVPSNQGPASVPYHPPSDREGDRRDLATRRSPSDRHPSMSRGGRQAPPQPPPPPQGEAGWSMDQNRHPDQWRGGWQKWNQGWSSNQWTESSRHPAQQMGGWNQQTAQKKKSPANVLRSKLRAQVKKQLQGASFVDSWGAAGL